MPVEVRLIALLSQENTGIHLQQFYNQKFFSHEACRGILKIYLIDYAGGNDNMLSLCHKPLASSICCIRFCCVAILDAWQRAIHRKNRPIGWKTERQSIGGRLFVVGRCRSGIATIHGEVDKPFFCNIYLAMKSFKFFWTHLSPYWCYYYIHLSSHKLWCR